MKKLLYNIVFLLVSVGLLFLIGEVILAAAYNLTHNSKFSTLVSKDTVYPKDPEGYLKIAIFGGSSAGGHNSERGFFDILKYELEKRYPEFKFYIKNYAKCGHPFHRHEAEILKAVIDKYDFFLIYAGHNEVANYLDDIGYFRTAKYKNQKTLIPFKVDDRKRLFISFLESKSRIYAVLKKIRNKFARFIEPYIKSSPKRDRVFQCKGFKEFDSSKVIPDNRITEININFRKDIEEIAKLANKHKKCVIISSVPINEGLKPFFSVHNPGLTGKEMEIFQANYERGLECYERNEFGKAISYFLAANEIDEHVAILNYTIGYSYLMTGEAQKGREFLLQSAEDDGFPRGALSSLGAIERSVSSNHDSLYFVDSVENFRNLLDRGITYKELFSDYNHPSLLGHIIIANNFLRKMSEIEPFRSHHLNQNYLDLDSADLKSLLLHYKKVLKVSDKDESQTAFMISRWYMSMTLFSSYPEYISDIAEDYLNKFYEKSDKNSIDRVTMLLFMALIEGERKNKNCEKALNLANQAQELSPGHTRSILYRNLCTGELIVDRLNKFGIFYSDAEKAFYLKYKE